MGFDFLNKVRHWIAGRSNTARDPENTAGGNNERASKIKRREDISDRLFKYRRVENTFPKFMPNAADDYSHMANTQINGQHEYSTNQTQKRLSMFNEPQTRQTRVRNAQTDVNVDLSDTEEPQHNESNIYQAFADRLAGPGTRPTYSEAVRYGVNGYSDELNFQRPSSNSSSSDARINGYVASLFDTGPRRNSVLALEDQRNEHNQYDCLINNLSLHDGEHLLRPNLPARGIEKPLPPAGIPRESLNGDNDSNGESSEGEKWLHSFIQRKRWSGREEYAKLLQQQQETSTKNLAKKPPPDGVHRFELGGTINDISAISNNDSKNITKSTVWGSKWQQPLPLSRTKAVQQRQNSSIFFSDNYADIFKEKRERLCQEANHNKKLILQEAEKVTEERRAYEQVLREALAKRRVLAQTMFVLEKYPQPEEDSTPEIIPFTEEHHKTYNEIVYGKAEKVLINKFSLSITRKDIRTLIGSCWLNDEVINFYMNLLNDRSERKDNLPSVYAMNTFFVPRLMQGYSNVRRWTRKVDIFSKDIIPVPVHVSNVHWCMAIIHLKDKTIRYYDSMGKPNTPVLNALEKYLMEESMDKRKMPFDTSEFVIENVQNVPHQTNGSDCGVFSCMFAEYITRNKPLTFSQEDMEYFRKKMVLEICGGELWK